MRLYDEKTEALTEEGVIISDSIKVEIDRILEHYADAGYSLLDLELVTTHIVSFVCSMQRVRRMPDPED
jgi:hypothetical protein